MTVGDAQGRAGCLHSERKGEIKFLWGVVLGLSESSASFGPGSILQQNYTGSALRQYITMYVSMSAAPTEGKGSLRAASVSGQHCAAI